ncbi:hypothetical protein [Desulfosporosinus fructosivorans]
MYPTTIIELALLLGATLGIGLLAFLLPEKIRKIIWVISCLVLIIGITFYGARPFIVQHQTNRAIEELDKRLEVLYPEDLWCITDTDEHKIKTVVYLHVIFESEPDLVYEYTVEASTIEQVGMWMLSGHSVDESEPQHKEY